MNESIFISRLPPWHQMSPFSARNRFAIYAWIKKEISVGFVIHCLFWIEPKSSKTRRLKMRLYLGIKWLNIGHKADLTKIKGYSKNVAWGVNLRLSVFLCGGLRKMGSWQREEGSNDIVHGRTSLTSILGCIFLFRKPWTRLLRHVWEAEMFTMEEFLAETTWTSSPVIGWM